MSILMSPPITNPLFCCKSTNVVIDSKNSIRLPSSSASKSSLFLSISSSSRDDRIDHRALFLHNNNNSTCSITRSFSSGASARDEASSLGKESFASDEYRHEEDGRDYEECGREEDMSFVDATVKVSGIVRVAPDYAFPWKMELRKSIGSGLIVSGRKVCTSARIVHLHKEVKLKTRNCDVWYTATVLAIAFEADLAILTVNNDEFWKGVKPVEFGDMPLEEEITLTGYPCEEDHVSVSKGRVVRGFLTKANLLAFKVEEDGNRWKVGGPVFNGRGKCVGMILDHGGKSGNIVDIAPAECIEHLIQDYDKNGAYTGVPVLGIRWQKMENFSLRVFMNMEHDQQGVLVTQIMPNYPEFEILKPYDVILSIDGISINNDGSVPFRQGQWIEFSYLIAQKYKGDKIVVTVLRDSKIHVLITHLPTRKQFVPANIIGMPPRYYVVGGFVFTTLSLQYFYDVDGRYDRRYPILIPNEDHLFSQAVYQERVVLCQVLKADITIGCEREDTIQNQVLVTFNDKHVVGLKNLVSMVESCEDEFMKFTLENHKILVLRTNVAKARTPDIVKAYGIPCAKSLE